MGSGGKTALWVVAGAIFGILGLLFLLLGGGSNQATEAEPVSQCAVDAGGDKKGVKMPEEYRPFFEKASKVSGVPVAILAAQTQQESAWDVHASSGFANGLSQFTPATWQTYGNGKSVWDPEASIDAQGRYMRDLVKQLGGLATSQEDKIRFALAGYNAGPGNVLKAKGIPPFPETQDYVRIIMGNAQLNFTKDCAPAVPAADAITVGPGEWVSPLPGSSITSGYGPRPCPFGVGGCVGRPYLKFHEGLDLAGGGSKYFYAPTDMVITYVSLGPIDKLWSSYGEYIYAVQVDAPHLVFEFHEAKQGSLRVKKGDTVKAGTPLGEPGATGNSSGIHLHFQVDVPGTNVTGPTIQNGKSTDPLPFLRQKGVAPQG